MILEPARLARAIRHRVTGDDGERGTIMMLLLVIIVSVTFGGVIMASVISQTHTSSYVQGRVQALDAAQAGIDTVLGEFRTATSTTDLGVGDSGRLPGCGTQTGTTSNGVSYSVTLQYYSADPNTLGTADLTTEANGKLMHCTDNAGPFNLVSSIRTPRYALITSVGSLIRGGQSVSRTLQSTYNFQVKDQNISGGQIRIFPSSGSQTTQYCMDAGASPAVGTPVKLQACSTLKPPLAQQVWAYRADLSIELVPSVTNPKAAGLCLDTDTSPSAAHGTTPQRDGSGNIVKDSNGNTVYSDNLVLKTCAVADSNVCNVAKAKAGGTSCSSSPWYQQWSIDDSAHLEGSKTDQSDLDGRCINVDSQAAGTALTLTSCAGGTADPKQTWIPAPTAGAGMAGAANQQLVNFQYFAMCLDVTEKNVGSPFQILYSCKQAPDPAKVAFNQRFIPAGIAGLPLKATDGPKNVLITVVNGSTTYCLKSPGRSSYKTKPTSSYPVLVQQGSSAGQCPTSVAAAGANSGFVWQLSQYAAADGSKTALRYANRYTIKDADTVGGTTDDAPELCLAAGITSDTFIGQYLKAIVAKCDGSTGQKWNADPSLTGVGLTNTLETPSKQSGN